MTGDQTFGIAVHRNEIEALIPHSGSMCLLDTVVHWDDDAIVCSSAGHVRADNPLAEHGRLDAVHALEYAAQAAAIHGALLARRDGRTPGAGRVASYRGVKLHVERLDGQSSPLDVRARRLSSAQAVSQLYALEVLANGRILVSGRWPSRSKTRLPRTELDE